TPIARLMKLWLLLRKLSRPLTKLTSALCACWKKPAAGNCDSFFRKPPQATGAAFLLPATVIAAHQAIKKPAGTNAGGLLGKRARSERRVAARHHVLGLRGDWHRHTVFGGNNLANHFPVEAQATEFVTLEQCIDHRRVLV